MKIWPLFILQVFSLFALYLPQEIATTSHGGQNTCHCRQFSISELSEQITINQTELNVQPLYMNIGYGGFGGVKHAFNLHQNKCYALKISQIHYEGRKNAVQRELAVLNYFNTLNVQQRSHIIKMHAWYKFY
uniref:Uncharacterized protein n=1 Tax=Meloidogyne enterolobii TaxID=390850 RepID=A0A6V7TXV9_MELEN|nr:unnamed protein product [Meloidogyne enterolobii]